MELTGGQRVVYDAIESGRSVFVSGEAGTGKTYVIKRAVEALARAGKNVVLCAPTGTAAMDMGGATIHSTFQLDFKPKVYDALDECGPSKVIHHAQVIVIDEVSMVRADLMDAIARVVAAENDVRAEARLKPGEEPDFPLDALQLVFVGDFFQLPPVAKKDERELLRGVYETSDHFYAFEAAAWAGLGLECIMLAEPVRQRGDGTFIAMLNRARCGDQSCLPYFNALTARGRVPEGAVRILARNDDVKRANEAAIAALGGDGRTFRGKVEGEFSPADMPTGERDVTVKVGERIMTLVNDRKRGYINGSTLTVVSLSGDEGGIVAEMDGGTVVEIVEKTWENVRYELDDGDGRKRVVKRVVGTFTQLPIKPAYAITYHKCQGKTFEQVAIDPSVWDPGQLYVGLSRCTKANGIYLSSEIAEGQLIADKRVVGFYERAGWRAPEPATGGERPPRHRSPSKREPGENAKGRGDPKRPRKRRRKGVASLDYDGICTELHSILGEKSDWARVYELISRVKAEKLYVEGGFKSFSAWLKAEADRASVSPSLLWHRKSAGDYYGEYRKGHPDAPELGEAHLTEENINLVRKIEKEGGLSPEERDRLMARLMVGVTGNGELKRMLKSAKSATPPESHGKPAAPPTRPHPSEDAPAGAVGGNGAATPAERCVSALAAIGVPARTSGAEEVLLSVEAVNRLIEMKRA